MPIGEIPDRPLAYLVIVIAADQVEHQALFGMDGHALPAPLELLLDAWLTVLWLIELAHEFARLVQRDLEIERDGLVAAVALPGTGYPIRIGLPNPGGKFLSLVDALLLHSLVLPSGIQRLQRHAARRSALAVRSGQGAAEGRGIAQAAPALEKLQMLPGRSRRADRTRVQLAQRPDGKPGGITGAPHLVALRQIALARISRDGMLDVLLVAGSRRKARLPAPPRPVPGKTMLGRAPGFIQVLP